MNAVHLFRIELRDILYASKETISDDTHSSSINMKAIMAKFRFYEDLHRKFSPEESEYVTANVTTCPRQSLCLSV